MAFCSMGHGGMLVWWHGRSMVVGGMVWSYDGGVW